MRNPLARLVHRDPAKPTLRERAAAMKASAARVIRRPRPVEAEPEVDWKGEDAPHAALSITVTAQPPMVDELLTGWAEWTKTDNRGASEAAWERNADMRDALLDRAAALPSTRENIPAKAIAQSWLEYVQVWERDKPRDSYGIEGGLCIAIDEVLRQEAAVA